MNKLPVMESFYTLQGEGMYHGSAAYFIRLAGCDVGCSWCDVKESWDAEQHALIDENDLVELAMKSGTKIVVVTGGEPLMYNLDSLTAKLKKIGLRTHLETSGAYPISGIWDWVCVSPKKFKPALPEVVKLADELKVIVVNHHDFVWAEQFLPLIKAACYRLLQPEWERSSKILPAIIEYVKANSHWRVSLQEHKFLNIP
ncbi:MAG: 7-carboxy-7-deazaguanine synthase QueE [Bacteroidetes bacterium]|nr:MAG: 7-carboxy-7-deazaguanine synthase QueE [Bacteroidota bacterium]